MSATHVERGKLVLAGRERGETAAGLCCGVWIPKGSRYRNSSYFQRTEEAFKWHQRARAGCVLIPLSPRCQKGKTGSGKVEAYVEEGACRRLPLSVKDRRRPGKMAESWNVCSGCSS